MARTTMARENPEMPRATTSLTLARGRQVVLSEEELAGLQAIIADPNPSAAELQAAFTQPDRFTFEGPSRIW